MAQTFNIKAEEEKFKKLARQIVSSALRTGELVKPKRCSNCPRRKNLQAHHENYYKPLDILWLCKRCHVMFDKARRIREKKLSNDYLTKEK